MKNLANKKLRSSIILTSIFCAVASLAVVTKASAVNTGSDPSGTWIWSNPGRNGGPGSTNTLVLKYSDNSLTGTLKAPKQGSGTVNLEISDAKLEGTSISFKVARTSGTNIITRNYSGTVKGDAIEGTMSMTGRDGAKHPYKWEAKRGVPGTK